MKQQILNLGNALHKNAQKQIVGGNMDVTCEEFGWNEISCQRARLEENGGFDHTYSKCC